MRRTVSTSGLSGATLTLAVLVCVAGTASPTLGAVAVPVERQDVRLTAEQRQQLAAVFSRLADAAKQLKPQVHTPAVAATPLSIVPATFRTPHAPRLDVAELPSPIAELGDHLLNLPPPTHAC